MGELYALLRPYLRTVTTYEDMVRYIYHADVGKLNLLFEKLTHNKADNYEGTLIVSTIIAALKENEFGAFVSLMKGE